MTYIQNGVGYTLKCDKCGTLLHREGKRQTISFIRY